MFQIIIVDDEIKALDRFERIVSEEPRVTIAGKFSRPEAAIEFAKQNPLDIAFLDIEMPGQNGLELAERLSSINPLTEIIFVTAYDKYALMAFQAHAIGYLLKPLDIAEFKKQIDVLSLKLELRQNRHKNNCLAIRCFGQFSCSPKDNEDRPMRFRTAKSEELFAILIHYQGKAIARDLLIEALWPDIESEKAANYFRVTCTYLRRAFADMGFPEILLRERDSYYINNAYISCDYFQFTSAISSNSASNLSELEKMAALYSGAYFENKPYHWAVKTRVWLENEYKKTQFRISEAYIACHENIKACSALEKILDQDPFEEEAVERIISLKQQDGNDISAVKVYKDYEQRLLSELGLSPSATLRNMLKNIIK